MSETQGAVGAPIHPLDQLYYVYAGAGALGPFTGSTVRAMIAKGEIDATASINTVGEPNWVNISTSETFEKFFSAAANPEELVYVGFWPRAAARLLDVIFIVTADVVVLLALLLLIGVSTDMESADFRKLGEQISDPVSSLVVLFYLLYFTSGKWQATPGKRIMGIHLVRVDGGRLTAWRALLRSLAEFLSTLILGVGYLMVFWTDQKKALHDMLCGTRVVRGRL
jgi:uncharacterized RDD family membrane protein YckC